MKKNLSLALAFMIVWVVVSGICYLIGIVFDKEYFLNPTNDIYLGFSSALGGIFGPILTSYISKKIKK